jgi:hypothetical protein
MASTSTSTDTHVHAASVAEVGWVGDEIDNAAAPEALRRTIG